MSETLPTGVAGGARAPREASGHIAARIDRIPICRIQYGLAGITQIYWGGLIATDAVVARLFPFLWGPLGMSTLQFSLMLSANIGAGILVGEYLGGFLSDRFGRKKILIASALVDAIFLWPLAYTNTFGVLLVFNFLYAIGMGFMLATNAVYMHEIVPPQGRHKIAMRVQLLTVVVILIPTVMAYFWIPAHYRWYIWGLVIIEVALTPLGLILPESPRWLEGKGRIEEADKIVSRWEAKAERYTGQPLPAPDTASHPVVATEHVPAKELFQGRYRSRTVLLLSVWLLGYPGLVYGATAYIPTFLVEHKWTPHEIFLWGGGGSIAAVPLVIIVFYAVSFFGERFERRTIIMVTGVLFGAALLVMLAFENNKPGVSAALLFVLVVGYLWLFNMYNYTAAAYPTRLRSVGTGWTDGVGHLGTFLGPPVIGVLFSSTAAHGNYGWILWCAILCGIVPSILLGVLGIRQRNVILEQIST
ncbi:MAG TPA: MFS transporter [Streptosporangiaceae bacterium]